VNLNADAPITADNRQYHLHTGAGDLASLCLLVGDPARATLIAVDFLEESRLVGDHRGFKSYTGTYRNGPVSVVTTGIGSPSLCTVIPEAYDSGARLFIRVGTCGSLIPESRLGDVIIVNRALRFEGTSLNYAPADFPAVADPRIVAALVLSAAKLRPGRYFVGTEATTDCFREGQGRPNTEGVLTDRAAANYKKAVSEGAACYSMEASALFVWCATHYGGVPCGAINAVIGNRITNIWGVEGEREAIAIALDASCSLRDLV
jgi:uridine phosphorylase